MIRTVIFDLDNTLIDFMKMKKISCEQAVESMIDAGLNMTKSSALKLIYKIYDNYGYEDPKIFQRFLEEVNGKIDYRILAHGITSYRQARGGFLHSYPGTEKTLLTIKKMNLKLAVVTDAPRLKAWIRLVSMHIDDLFDIVVTFEDTGRHKPSKLPFKKALTYLNMTPEQCLMVGDSPGRDMKGARLMGIKTCHAAYGYEGNESVESDFVINHIEDIVKIIKSSR